jgi:hypothetical protein
LLAVVGAAALLGVAPAQADSSGSNNAPNKNPDDSISAAIEKFGQSLCPSLVKPGSSLASTLSELQGNTGLTPTLTGMIAGWAIQSQCPSVMTQLSKGDLSALKLLSQDQPPTSQNLSGLDLSALLKPTH